MLRTIAAFAVLIAALFLERALIVPQWHCDIQMRTIRARTDEIERHGDSLGVYPAARENVRRLTSCLNVERDNVEAWMLLAANFLALDKKLEAAAAYREALKYDRRPELFFSLGLVELDLGQRDAAIKDLTTAATFNPNVTDAIVYDDVRQIVFNRVHDRQKQILARTGVSR